MRTLVIGLGNPILGDDGVGWKVAEEVKSRIGNRRSSIEVDCASLGGLSLMERMLGYARVIVIDSMQTGQGAEGCVRTFPLNALENPGAGHTASTHDASLLTSLQAAGALGADIPSRIDIVAIEVRQAYDFSEQLSPAVERAVSLAMEKVLELLNETSS